MAFPFGREVQGTPFPEPPLGFVVPALLEQDKRPPQGAFLTGGELGQTRELAGLPVTGPQCAGQHTFELLHSLTEKLVGAHAAPPQQEDDRRVLRWR